MQTPSDSSTPAQQATGTGRQHPDIQDVPVRTDAPNIPSSLYRPLTTLVVFCTAISCLGLGSIGPYTVKGYAWVALLIVALAGWLHRGFRHRFPIWIWIPWSGYLLVSLLQSNNENALQRTLLMICPFVVAGAVSARPVTIREILGFLSSLRFLAIFLLLAALARVGVLTTGALPAVTGLAPESITASFLACIFAAEFSLGHPRALAYWLFAVTLPIVGVTRMATLASLVTLPTTLTNLGHMKRLLTVGAVLVLGAVVFFSQRFQEKMFQAGTGTVRDIRLDSSTVRDSGRFYTWKMMSREADKKPWFGHGANANEAYMSLHFGFKGQPHNDWLRVRFDYGYVGVFLLAGTMLVQILHAFRQARRTRGIQKTILLAGISGFIPFVLLMLTDNVLIYAVFFGNLHFTTLALGYATLDEASGPRDTTTPSD